MEKKGEGELSRAPGFLRLPTKGSRGRVGKKIVDSFHGHQRGKYPGEKENGL